MPETNAIPTRQEVLLIRGDLNDYADRTLESYIADSLAEVKRILEDDRGVVWSRVFDTTADAYLDNTDSTGRNEDRIKNAISHMTAAMVFRDYSIKQNLEESWSMLADYHETKAMDRILKSKLDVDWDDSGTIVDAEENQTGQPFMVR